MDWQNTGKVQADDLEVNNFVMLRDTECCCPIRAGVPLKIKAIQLPFIAVTPLPIGTFPVFSLDTRDVVLIKVDEEYRRAFAMPMPNSPIG